MNRIFVAAFKDELEKIAKGIPKRYLIPAAGIGTAALLASQVAKGAEKGRREAIIEARQRQGMY